MKFFEIIQYFNFFGGHKDLYYIIIRKHNKDIFPLF